MPAETDGIYCVLSHRLAADLPLLLELATREKIPVISRIPGLAEQGALMVLETDPVEQGEKLAGYVNRLIQGSPLRELPPDRPRNVALVVNMKTAADLEIQVPFEILAVTSRLVR
jgi:putative ABC transport system substrate-binding protein